MAERAIKFQTTLKKHRGDYIWHYIAVDKETGEKFPVKEKSRRVLCSVNGKEKFHCALMHDGNGAFWISVSKAMMKKFGLSLGDELDVSLWPDNSKYGVKMPEEFTEVLKQDPPGSKLFHKLTAGKQRSLIFQIIQFKDIDRRIHSALIVLEHLKDNDGSVNAEKLMQELKRPIIF